MSAYVDTEGGGGPAPARQGRAEKLAWMFNRLRCMSPAEVSHRVGRMARMHGERLGLALRALPSVPEYDLSLAPPAWLKVPSAIRPEAYVEAAERAAAGRFDVFALENADLGSPPRWNRDPKTGTEPPLAFGKLLDYRDERLVGDIKYLWEPNRHLHIVTLAQASRLSGGDAAARYAQALRAHLESWFEACPFPMGANWASALEPAIRLINWSVAWQLLGSSHPVFEGTQGRRFRHAWLESVYRHAQFVHGHFSLYSSANNHLIGEASGLYMAALTWPLWKRARKWEATAKTVLEREALLQNAPDGVNREQAIAYQQWELDLLLLPYLAARAAGRPFSSRYAQRIERMLEYLAAVMDCGGNLPMFGDADDGCVVRLSPQAGFRPHRSLLATGAVLFGNAALAAKAGSLDDKTRWLLGEEAERGFAAFAPARPGPPARRAFPEGGYYILGCEFETEREIRLVADAGPLGYGNIAAHGHADALSFTLSLGGSEFLFDPGTYAYHTQGQWRRYFRGTSAHNTIRIDGRDQSEPGGNFMWLKKARAQCSLWEETPETDTFEGWHDGYLRLGDPVLHRRRITLDKRGRRIVITDELEMRGRHEVELFFHCAEHCSVQRNGRLHVISRDGRSLVIRLPDTPSAAIENYRASLRPPAGWVSRRFDRKEPAPTLVWRATLAGNQRLTTELIC
ncbi:MAG TPA: alginate lyase family protein [Burkholderiales bacterium]|nr:alginate lyase family protein [Burkholderiales bacterium]